MNTALLMKLAQLALEHGPEMVQKIRELIKNFGEPVDAERYEGALETLRKDPESYFGERRPDKQEQDEEDPAATDPTVKAYDTVEEAAEEAKKTRGYGVAKYEDGTFHVCPLGVGPLPGEIVWRP